VSLDLKGSLFHTPEQVATMFGKPVRWVYRHGRGEGFLAPAARRFNSKTLLFLRSEVEKIIAEAAGGPAKIGVAPGVGELYNSTHRRAET
jgi:hypothetical protein